MLHIKHTDKQQTYFIRLILRMQTILFCGALPLRQLHWVSYRIWLCATIMLTIFFGGIPQALAASGFNLPYGVTPVSHQQYELHMAALIVCTIIGIFVFGALFYSLYKFRHSKGAKPAHFHENMGVEIAWTVIPFLILVGLAIPATIVLKNIDNTNNPAMTIDVKGYQWYWKYSYLDQGISFYSRLSTPQNQIAGKAPRDKYFLREVNHPLVVPVDEKIRLLVTSNDVIHSWWVPALGVKQDAIPGYVNENWMYIDKPGIYRGQCAELCGTLHAFMPIVVKAVSKLQFAEWVRAHEPHHSITTLKENENLHLNKYKLVHMGRKLYLQNCAVCHQDNGKGLPPNFPSLHASKVVVGPLANNISLVLHGVKGTPMPAWSGRLNDEQLASILTFIRNAWGNASLNKQHHYVTIVEPKMVFDARTSQ